MWIRKSLFLLPDLMVKLFCHICFDCIKLRLVINQLSIAEDRHLQLLHIHIFKLHLLPRLHRIHVGKWFISVYFLVVHRDQISKRISGLTAVNTPQLLSARIRDLFNVLRDLDLRHKFPGIILHSSKLVDTTKDRIGFRRDHTFSDAVGINACVLLFQ